MAKILYGITASIAAYRAGDVVRSLSRDGHDVHVIITERALNLVTSLTFQTLSGNRVNTDREMWSRNEMAHIDLKTDAALLVIAPATADIIGKYASGIADDLLSTTLLSVTCPVMLAPAMNPNMLNHPSVQDNMKLLRERGVHFIEPAVGSVVCGDEGRGRLAEPDEIQRRINEFIAG